MSRTKRWGWTALWLAGAAIATARDVPPPLGSAIQHAEGAVVRLVVPARPDEDPDPADVQDAVRRYSLEGIGDRRLLGTGVILTPEGEIVTSRHVIDGVERLRVRLSTDEEIAATVVGTDPLTDLALVRIDAKRPLPALSLDDAHDVAIGDWVVVIGNGFGPLPSASAGIVGTAGRFLGLGPGRDLLQTDITLVSAAAGAPLLDVEGGLVGVCAVPAEPGGGAPGVGFAVPAELVRGVVGQIRARGHVVRGWLGLTVQPVTPELAGPLRLSVPEGALVADIAAGSPAAKAGLRRGDVVVRIGEHDIHQARDLPVIVAALVPETTVTITFVRDGKEHGAEATVREESAAVVVPPSPARAQRATPESEWGFSVRAATTIEAKRYGFPPNTGVVIDEVEPDSAAEEGGLEPGDVIVQANRGPIPTVTDLRRALAANPQHALLLVRRDTASLFVELDR